MQGQNGTGQHPPIERLVLDNGITVILAENPAADLVASRIFVKQAGVRWEPRAKAGLSHLLAAAIAKGTERLTAAEIAEEVESVGASLGADAASDYLLLSFKTVSADFRHLLELVRDILRFPTFPAAEVELEKRFTLQNIRAQQEQPFNVAFQQLREAMYPAHPYGLSILGTEATVAELSQADLQAYHQQHFRPERLVFSFSGRIALEDAIPLLERTFGDWQVASASPLMPSLPDLHSSPCQKTFPQDTQQSIVMLGYLAAAVKSEDYPVLKLLSTYLGNGLSSRLFVELREKRGLAYDVSAFYPTRLDPAQFVTYLGTAPPNTAIALEGLRKEAERLSQSPLTPEELQTAKNKLLGQYALGKQTNSEIAQLFGWYEALGLGIEFDRQFQAAVAQVTPETAQRVARSYLLSPYISLVGPAAAVANF